MKIPLKRPAALSSPLSKCKQSTPRRGIPLGIKRAKIQTDCCDQSSFETGSAPGGPIVNQPKLSKIGFPGEGNDDEHVVEIDRDSFFMYRARSRHANMCVCAETNVPNLCLWFPGIIRENGGTAHCNRCMRSQRRRRRLG